MEDRKRFEAACNLYPIGPRLNIEEFPDVPAFPVYKHTRKIALELISSAYKHLPKLPPIHFDFVQVSNVNAWAFKHDNHYFIAVTAGAVCMLHLVLDRILANPNTFEMIGDPTLELQDIQLVDWNIVDPERLFNDGVRPVVAQDPARQLYSKHLADQALMFLIGHEIAHITRGHVDFVTASSNQSFIAKVGFRGGEARQRLERQAIEADADRRSIFARCKSQFMTAENNEGRRFPWSDKPVVIESLQFDWAFAVNVLFRLFGDHRFADIDLDSVSYPPLALRRRLAMDFGFTLLLRNWGREHESKIFDALAGSIRTTEDAFIAIGASSAKGGFDEAYADVGTQHVKRIVECWNGLKPELERYSFESLR